MHVISFNALNSPAEGPLKLRVKFFAQFFICFFTNAPHAATTAYDYRGIMEGAGEPESRFEEVLYQTKGPGVGRGPCFYGVSCKVRGGAGRGAWAVATHGPCWAWLLPRDEGGGGGAEIEFQALWLERSLGHSRAQGPAPVPPWSPQPTHALAQLSSCWPSPQDGPVRGKQGRRLKLEPDILLGVSSGLRVPLHGSQRQSVLSPQVISYKDYVLTGSTCSLEKSPRCHVAWSGGRLGLLTLFSWSGSLFLSYILWWFV